MISMSRSWSRSTVMYVRRKPHSTWMVCPREDMLQARNFKNSPKIRDAAAASRDLVEDILQRGAAAKVFRSGLDPMQVSLTTNWVCYYYLANQATRSIIYRRKMKARAAMDE